MEIGDTPYVLAPGSYFTHEYEETDFSDDKFHIVYGGNLRKDKGGAYLAIEAAKYLSDRYVVHSLSGSYSDYELKDIMDEISNVQNQTGASIIFEGSKFGDEYFEFLTKCDIGLATQHNGDFSNTSFPSKILTYLGCGLKVVSTPIDAVRLSPVSDFVFSYKESEGKSIADCIIRAVELDDIDVVDMLKVLDGTLKNEIRTLMS